jgi:hypothetical protein
LLPLPEQICLVIRIDALGVHEIGLYKRGEALGQLADWLPRGDRAEPGPGGDPDEVLAASQRSALITVTRYTTQGSAETAGTSTDLVLARLDGKLHEFRRDPAAPDRLVPGPKESKDVRDTLGDLLAEDVRAA